MRRLGMRSYRLAFVAGILFLVFLAPVLFGSLGWGWSSSRYGWGMGPWTWSGFGFPFMGVAMIVFCVFMMGGMVMHGGHSAHEAGSGLTSPHGESNLDILERRYSQGEITKEEYEGIKRDLGL